MSAKYVIAIDQSTSATKAFLMDAAGHNAASASREHKTTYPRKNYVEQDAQEIYENTRDCIDELVKSVDIADIAALGICNQRETAVIWDRQTGMPAHPVIVWQDTRGEADCAELAEYSDMVLRKTGLKLSPYYTAGKVMHALKHDANLRALAAKHKLCIGTMDSYLLFRLTDGRVFATDVSNASRTQLMDINSLAWDAELCDIFGIPLDALPEIRQSDADFGRIYNGIPVRALLGDSHAALFGQQCTQAGQVKATYGTGSSVMMNVGFEPVAPSEGLSASVGFSFRCKTHYVLEGNVTCSGDTLVWLRDCMHMIDDIKDIEARALSAGTAGDVVLVPAFAGLGAPYFDSGAQATITGITRDTRRGNILYAALESIAYQDADVLLSMKRASSMDIKQLRADGGPTKNRLLMQMQADMCGCDVICGAGGDLSALGVGLMAGFAAGIYSFWPESCKKVYSPQNDEAARADKMRAWYKAIERTRL